MSVEAGTVHIKGEMAADLDATIHTSSVLWYQLLVGDLELTHAERTGQTSVIGDRQRLHAAIGLVRVRT